MKFARALGSAALIWLLPVTGSAQTTTIDFENLNPRTRVTTQYAARGVRFEPSAFLDEDPQARSGTNVLRSRNPTEEFDTGALQMVFTSNQREVSFFAGAIFAGTQGTLRAFDADGNLIATDGPKAIAANAFTTEFSVSTAESVIVRAVLHYQGTAFEALDDLSFSGQPVIDLPTSPPTIQSFQVTGVGTNNELQSAQVVISGAISGPQMISPGNLAITRSLPEESMAPTTTTNSVQLNVAGEVATFALPMALFVGEQTVTLTVQNAAGLTSEQILNVRVLPELIRSRIQEEGGFDSVGAFRFSGHGADCIYVVFEELAVATRIGSTSVVEGAMLDAWLQRTNPSGFPSLGCPSNEENRMRGNVSSQQFDEGLLFVDNGRDFEVPNVFAAVLASDRREEQPWIPVMDPVHSSGAMQTWQFQRFRREGSTAPSITLEIRGMPPRVLVERGRGGRVDGIVTTAPVWDMYECEDLNGPCNLDAGDPPPLSNTGEFCGNETYDWEGLRDALLTEGLEPSSDPPEWVPVDGHYTQTPVRGIVKTSKLSSGDNPFTHSEVSFPACVDAIQDVVTWAADGEPPFCGVDWNVDVIPNPGFRGVLSAGRNTVHVEWQNPLARALTAFGFDVIVGDTFFASGRWAIDCGHDSFKTEIHPPSVIARTRSAVFEDGRPSTISYVWVNGWYSGEDVEVLLFPPPRPSPNATLSILREEGTLLDVNRRDPSGLWMVRLLFDASRREVEVTNPGEMKFEPGRDYKSRWTLSWSE